LTEYFGRLNHRSTERYPGQLPDYVAKTVKRIRGMKVSAARLAEREAREHMTAFPGPLETADDPPGCSARMKAARKATRLLMAMKAGNETPELAKRFDSACAVIDDADGDLGSLIRDKVFNWQPMDDTEGWTDDRLNATTVCKKVDGMMTIMAR
jgi:hypothetical protein